MIRRAAAAVHHAERPPHRDDPIRRTGGKAEPDAVRCDERGQCISRRRPGAITSAPVVTAPVYASTGAIPAEVRTMTISTPATDSMADRTVEILQAALVELIDLSLQGKQAHWTVTGPLFKPVHEHLDAIVDELRVAYDDVAERMAALDVPPDGRPATVVADSPVNPLRAGWQADTEVVARMLRRLEGLSGRMGGWIEELGDLDAVTQDMLIGIRQGVDKHAWMLRSQTRGA